jgi:hypothetical protein
MFKEEGNEGSKDRSRGEGYFGWEEVSKERTQGRKILRRKGMLRATQQKQGRRIF